MPVRDPMHALRGRSPTYCSTPSFVPSTHIGATTASQENRLDPIIECITVDCGDARRVSEFWAQVLGYVIEDEKGDWVLMRPSEGLGPRLAFAPVPEPKTVKNRVHLDIQPSGTTLESEVERLGALGATRVRLARNAPDEIHTVM